MEVGFVMNSASRLAGGMFNSARGLARALIESDQAAVAVLSTVDEYPRDLAAWSPTMMATFPRWGPRSFSFSPGLRVALRDRRFDLVHTQHLWGYGSIAVSQKASMGVPYVVSPRGMLDAWALRNARWKKAVALRLYERRHLTGAGLIHALTEQEAQSIRRLGVKGPIVVIPNGVDLPNDVEANSTSGAGDGRRVLLFLGRIHPKKGLSELLRAWFELKATSPRVARNWRLVIAGWDDGGHESRLKALVADLELMGDVSFVGAVVAEQKDALLRGASGFVLSSYSEGLPMSVLEAWSYHLPVFMTRECNLPEGFLRGAAFEISRVPKEMAARFSELLDDTTTLREAGAAGRNLVVKEFCWATIASQMTDVYRWLVSGGSRPSTLYYA